MSQTSRKRNVTPGIVDKQLKKAIVKWCKEIWTCDFGDSIFGPFAILSDTAVESLSSFGNIERLINLESALGRYWAWFGWYGIDRCGRYFHSVRGASSFWLIFIHPTCISSPGCDACFSPLAACGFNGLGCLGPTFKLLNRFRSLSHGPDPRVLIAHYQLHQLQSHLPFHIIMPNFQQLCLRVHYPIIHMWYLQLLSPIIINYFKCKHTACSYPYSLLLSH